MYLKQAILKIKNRFLLCAFILSAYGLYLRLIKLFQHELWADEYYQLAIMNGSFWDMLKAIPQHEYGSYLSGDLYLPAKFLRNKKRRPEEEFRIGRRMNTVLSAVCDFESMVSRFIPLPIGTSLIAVAKKRDENK